MHSHPDCIVYALSDFKVKFTYPDGKLAELEGKTGGARWRDAESHAAENIGTTELHVLSSKCRAKGVSQEADACKEKGHVRQETTGGPYGLPTGL